MEKAQELMYMDVFKCVFVYVCKCGWVGVIENMRVIDSKEAGRRTRTLHEEFHVFSQLRDVFLFGRRRTGSRMSG